MRKLIVDLIRGVACMMLVVGVISFIVCLAKADKAGSGYFSREPVLEFVWNVGAIYSAATAISSFFVFGFSFVVEAACRYLDRCDLEDTETVKTEQ